MLLHLENLSFAYQEKPILSSVTHSFEEGNTTLVGKNGVGKSTLIHLIADLLSPESGEVRLQDDQGYLSKRQFRDTAVLIEGSQRGFYPRLSGIDNLRFISCLRKSLLNKGEAASILDKIAFSTKEMNTKFQDYSSGMRQRLQIAKAFIEPNCLLLFDEPTSYLDQDSIAFLIDYLNNQSRDKVKLIVSHDAKFISQLETRMIKLDAGKISQI